jgi:tripartite-type tricarboxylate transporter receptor subunit TctC
LSPTRRAVLVGLLAAGTAQGQGRAQAPAQGWPSRPIRVVIPFAPGGSSDIAARLVAPRLGALLGQPVQIENRGGAGGNIAAEAVARAAPDGHSVFQGNIGTLAVNPALYRALSYDVRVDFAPVSHLMSVFYVLVSPLDRPWRDLAGLLAAGRAQPEALSAGNSGVGSMGHLASFMFDQAVGMRSVPVPYRGGGPLANDLLAGKLDYSFSTVPTVLSLIEAGQIRAIAVATPTRSPLLPQVPTLAESGLPGFEVPNWDSWLLPRGTPEPVVARLAAAMGQVLREPEIIAAFRARGMEPMPTDPARLGAEILERIAQFAPVVRATGASAE